MIPPILVLFPFLLSLILFFLFFPIYLLSHDIFIIFLLSSTFFRNNPLKGGIHRYLEEYPTGGFFEGKNFVFDSRVSVPAVTDKSIGTNNELREKIDVEEEKMEKCGVSGFSSDSGNCLDNSNDGIAFIEKVFRDDLNPINSTDAASCSNYSCSNNNNNINNNNSSNNDNDNNNIYSNSSNNSSSNNHDDTKSNLGGHLGLGSTQDMEHTTQIPSCDKNVIGRCVDCSCPYDSFSGLIVCTVCRLPVLVCTICAVEKCYPGEYHCFRHR